MSKLFALILSVLLLTVTSGDLCPAERQMVLELVMALGKKSDFKENLSLLNQLAEHSQNAAEALVKELTVVTEQQIGPADVSQHPKAMHVLWCVRALRYITGLDFKGKTADKPMKGFEYIWQFVTDKDELPFFVVWMSRDIVYLAPQDAQTEIIRQWNHWYKEKGDIHKYRPRKSINEWYF